MPPEASSRAHGSQALAISNAMVSLMHGATGRGPQRTRTEMGHDTITVVMQDGLTKSERTLASNGRENEVLETRRAIQQIIGNDAIKAIEELSGRKVLAFMSENHIDPDVAAEVFVLEPRPRDEGQPAGEADG